MFTENTFNGGLNSDLSKLILPPNKYLNCQNMRPVTETGSSTASLDFIRGNKHEIDIPSIWPVYKLQIVATTLPVNCTITILGNTTSVFTLTNANTGLDLINQISLLTGYNTSFFAAYDDTSIIIWSTSNNSLTDPSVTFTGSGLSYISYNGTDQYLPTINNLFPIGSTFIRDKYYLFTCNNMLNNPGGHNPDLTADPNQLGQIWEMEYDFTEPNTLNTTLKLVYNNFIDFTGKHPIPPTATEGRYENNSIQRIYWSDNFNTIRSINVSDDNAMILDPSLLDIIPAVDFSIPILQEVLSGGNLTASAYEFVYRLTNNGGSITAYSNPSNIIYIAGSGYSDVTTLNSSDYRNYIGHSQGTSVSKSIKIKIENIDTDFDFIEIVVLKRDTKTDNPDIFQILQEPVPSTGTFEFIYTGNEETIEIPLETFISRNNTFTHCKTMATKDNILFLGNIRNVISDLDYDARAYNFNSSGICQLTNGSITSSYNGLIALTNLPETSDAINPNRTIFKYQSNGTVLGGEGLNIKYTFGTVLIPMDRYSDFSNIPAGVTHPAQGGLMYQNFQTHSSSGTVVGNAPTLLDLNVLYNNNTTTQKYPSALTNIGNKLPYYNGLFKGYKRNEIYRFGIQFYDKKNNPYFVKWIADIKMPDHYDTNNNAYYLDGTSASAISTNFKTVVMNSTYAYTQQLYVDFEVDIPQNISDKIGGYSIVRVERNKDDMTIAGQGLLLPFEGRGGTDYEVPGAIRQPLLYAPSNMYTAMFVCPDWLLDPGLYPNYSANDSISSVGKYASTGTFDDSFGLSGGQAYYMQKTYNPSQSVFTRVVTGLQYFPQNGAVTIGADTFYNESTDTASRATSTEVQSNGSACHIITTSNLMDFSSATIAGNTTNKSIVDYYRSGVVQYGGNTYSQRSRNEYISCNHYRPYRTQTSSFTDNFKVFGGDTWVNPIDVQKLIKNWGGSVLYSSTQFFFVETRLNIPYRQANYVSYNLDADDGTGASASETYTYNNVYNNESDIIKYIPKSLLFNNTEEWDNRIVYSAVKINGEIIDSWRSFAVNNIHEVEGSYGPINALITLNNYDLYYLQDRGFGKCLINPTVINSSADLPTVLGTGQTIQTSTYLSTDCGTKHQWSVTKSNSSLLWIDSQKNRIYMFNGQLRPISDIKGMKSFMNRELLYNIVDNDNPINDSGIVSTYDYENNEYLITFLNNVNTVEYTKESTLVFNELTDEFTSFYTFYPQLYINNNRKYFTVGTRNKDKLYSHNTGLIGQFYGSNEDAFLKLIINKESAYTKVLDNISWLTEVITDDSYTNDQLNENIYNNTWDRIRIYNDYQNTDIVTLDVSNKYSLRRVERSWNLQCPRNKVLYSTSSSPNIFTDLGTKTYSERMRDKYFIIELYYNNTNNYRFIMHMLKCSVRLSTR